MRQGAAISAAIHGGLLAWAMLGGLFSSEPPEMTLKVSEVTLLSEEELTSLGSPENVVQPGFMDAPSIFDESAHLDDPTIEMPSIEPPQLPDEPMLVPDENPAIASPDSPIPGILEFAPPEIEDLASSVVDMPEPPPIFEVAPPQSERVDTAPAPRPEPEVKIADSAQEEIAPGEVEEAERPAEEQEATAKKEASTRIVTEAERSPTEIFSVVPMLRPTRIDPSQQETELSEAPDTETSQQETDSQKIMSAILQDKESRDSSVASRGPERDSDERLTVSDIEGLNREIQPCWNVGALSSEASRVVVTISIQFDREGKPIKGGTRRVEASRSTISAQNQAYEVAIRAVTQCLRNGYEFPPEKYEQWRQIELTFNPERMRLK
ncbi:MAG: hypothetical protein OXN84_15440 [Albidovulum sp.]|nr:hypothetical protein [Albidovulum sp.]